MAAQPDPASCSNTPHTFATSPWLHYTAGSAVAAFKDVQWIGLDLDHTAARYVNTRAHAVARERNGTAVPTDAVPRGLFELVYVSLRNALIHDLALYPATALPWTGSAGPDVERFIAKGVIFDFHTGDLLKLDACGHVVAALHGTTMLTPAAIEAKYPRLAWPGLPLLRARGRHEHFYTLITYFDAPVIPIVAQLVDYMDDQRAGVVDPLAAARAVVTDYSAAHIQPYYASIPKDLGAAFNHIFDNEAAWESGGFMPTLRAFPHLYVTSRPSLKQSLLAMRASGRFRTFLATNSHVKFANLIAAASLGEDWRSCFDLVIYDAQKPAFFTSTAPFHHVGVRDGSVGGLVEHVHLHAAQSPPHRCLACAHGNAVAVQHIADEDVKSQRATGGAADAAHACGGSDASIACDVDVLLCAHLKEGAHVSHIVRTPPAQTRSLTDDYAADAAPLQDATPIAARAAVIAYAGDHIHGDVAPAQEAVGWRSVAVVEELDCMPPPTCVAVEASPAISSREGMPNFDAAYARDCVWGNFFEGAQSAAGVHTDACRESYFARVLRDHATIAVADVEPLLSAVVAGIGGEVP